MGQTPRTTSTSRTLSKSSSRTLSRTQNRVRARPNRNRSRARQQNVELIPVEKKTIDNVEKPRSTPQRIRPAASQRRRNRPSQVRRPVPTPAPRIAPVVQPFQPFQFPLQQAPNPTPSFFEDIPFVKAVNEIAPQQIEEIVEYEDEEPVEIVVEPVTVAPRRRPAQTTVPKKFHAGVVKPQKGFVNGDRVKVLDRYSHRNEDGSFTWGYQSSDGSFKEETIGVDCITKGRYGYVDPFGEVREFSYQSGNECDPQTKQPLQKESRTPKGRKRGYFDYNANRYVTKDGRKGKLIVNKNNRRRG